MTKRQHYIPRFYLERFADAQGFVYTYDYRLSKSYKIKPAKVCCQNCLYEVEWNGSERMYGTYMQPNHIEKIFSGYETEFSEFLRRMDKICYPGQNPDALICSPEDKKILFRLVINFFVRTPQVMDAMSINKIPKGLEEIECMKALREGLNLMGIGGWDSYVKMANKKILLTEEFDGGPEYDLRSEVSGLSFTFLRAQKNCFITSKHPVALGTDNYILENNKTCLYAALSPKIAVLFGNYEELKHKKNRMMVIGDSAVDEYNMIMTKKEEEMQGEVIAGSEESVKKYCHVKAGHKKET